MQPVNISVICSRPKWCGRDRDFIKYSETWKFVDFAEIFQENVVITSKLNFFQISGIFPTCIWLFLACKVQIRQTRYSLNYGSFTKPFLCDIESLKAVTDICSLPDWDETWNHRDSQKWVSRLYHCLRLSKSRRRILIYLFVSRHEVHSMNTHTLRNAGR